MERLQYVSRKSIDIHIGNNDQSQSVLDTTRKNEYFRSSISYIALSFVIGAVRRRLDSVRATGFFPLLVLRGFL
jgi:hypothetical protein